MSLTPFELSALELSLRVGIASVLCSLPLGLATAWLLARFRFPGKTLVDVDPETGQKVMRLLEALDDHDDVQNVYSNLNLTEAMVEAMEKG